MKLRLGKLAILWGDRCALETCEYFTHYLRHGPPQIPHAAYHKATQECLLWLKAADYYLKKGEEVPAGVERICLRLEKEVRA